jgi:predicted HicB family RNase H-like nuclease
MADRMSIGPYKARIRYWADIDVFRGRVVIDRDWIEFVGRSVAELRREFRVSMRFYEEAVVKRPKRRRV